MPGEFEYIAWLRSRTPADPRVLIGPGDDCAALAPTDRPDVGYAMIFPSMTILKILFVNIAAALM